MSYADLLSSFLGYVMQNDTCLLNNVSLKYVDKTPYEIWNGKRPKQSYLKIWRCNAYVKHIVSEKLVAKLDTCKFVGYLKESIGYYFYHPIKQKMFVSKYVTFWKEQWEENRSW
jgi:hypothetical protein